MTYLHVRGVGLLQLLGHGGRGGLDVRHQCAVVGGGGGVDRPEPYLQGSHGVLQGGVVGLRGALLRGQGAGQCAEGGLQRVHRRRCRRWCCGLRAAALLCRQFHRAQGIQRAVQTR